MEGVINVFIWALIILLAVIFIISLGRHMVMAKKTVTGGGGFFGKIIARHEGDQFIKVEQEPDIAPLFDRGGDRAKLKVTKEGLYSITPPRLSRLIVDTIEAAWGAPLKGLTITDATGGMGGDTMTFARAGMKVNSVEKSPDNFAALKSNIDAYGEDVSRMITLYPADYLEIMDTLTQDIVFMDPPWTGLNYRDVAELRLTMSGRDVGEVVENLKGKCKMVALKLPNNFALDEFLARFTNHAASVHDLGKLKLVIIKWQL